MMTLQGNPHRSAAKGIGRGYREGMSGTHDTAAGVPEHIQMVTAIPRLSNIFLHVGQGVEKKGEKSDWPLASRGRKIGRVGRLVL
jgi:hypothetical protein